MKKNPFPWPKNHIVYVFIVVVIFGVLNNVFLVNLLRDPVTTVDYSTFVRMAQDKTLSAVQIHDDSIVFESDGRVFTTIMAPDFDLVDRLIESGAAFKTVLRPASPLGALVTFLNIAVTGALVFWLFRMMRGGQNGVGAFGLTKSGAKLYELNDTSKKFDDVAGQEEAKEALNEIVDFLHNPQKYTAIGAKLPKGALLVGPPGTGKTLIAQAVAGEANVPFFFVSGSAFVEMFVGQGAARVRDLFKQASDKAPCIVFIDEIDAIGKKRDTLGIASNDEREQSLNQLLAEMDGFDPGKGIVVLGATNRPEILDKALLRPGRFDRRVTMDLPDLKDREAVLRVHARGIQVSPDVDFTAIARATVGTSGADLANIVNEGALRAVREGHKMVTQTDLESAIDTVIAGSERKSMVIPERERRMIAYHEVGHALVAAKQKDSAPVHKITIVPRTSGALGFTMQVDEDDHVLDSREALLSSLSVFAAGRAAEEFIFGTCTTGAVSDIERMTKLARAMVTRYGMSDEFGMMALETGASQFLGTEGQLTCSADTAAKIDTEVKMLVQNAYNQAKTILQDNASKLNQISSYLIEKETIWGDEFMQILNADDAIADVSIS